MKKALLLVLLVVATMLSLCACGKALTSADMPCPLECNLNEFEAFLGKKSSIDAADAYKEYEDISIDGLKLSTIKVLCGEDKEVGTVEFVFDVDSADQSEIINEFYNRLLSMLTDKYGESTCLDSFIEEMNSSLPSGGTSQTREDFWGDIEGEYQYLMMLDNTDVGLMRIFVRAPSIGDYPADSNTVLGLAVSKYLLRDDVASSTMSLYNLKASLSIQG